MCWNACRTDWVVMPGLDGAFPVCSQRAARNLRVTGCIANCLGVSLPLPTEAAEQMVI